MLLRGGTSKGVFFAESDMPVSAGETRDALLLDAFGSPDPMQLDGIGGSHSTTSKTVVVEQSSRPRLDVEYTFGQVGIEKPVVDWGGNCGNLTFAVAAFAIERGLVDVEPSGRRTFRLLNVNTDTVVEQTIEVGADGEPVYDGEFSVDGVPGENTRIRSRFVRPAGTETGSLFPTGERRETLEMAVSGPVEVSIVDVSNPVVFVRDGALDVDATANPADIDASTPATRRLEAIRAAAGERLGIVEDASVATERSPGLPKVAFVGEPRPYETVGGRRVDDGSFDVLARIMSMQKAHHAYAVTGAMCTATAARISGTIPNEYAETPTGDVVLGHPKGLMEVAVDFGESETDVEAVTVDRTARKIIDGELYYGPLEAV